MQDNIDAEERALIAQANVPQEAAVEAAPEVDADAMDLEDEDPSQMNIVQNYQRQDPRCVCNKQCSNQWVVFVSAHWVVLSCRSIQGKQLC